MQTLAVWWTSLIEFLTTESIWVAAAMATTTVIGLIFGRYEIRLRRLRMIRDYIAAFPTTAGGDGAQGINPSFEFVRTKYSADVEPYAPPPEASRTPPNGEPGAKENADELVSQITATIEQTHRFGRRHDRQLLWSSLPYALVVTSGFYLALIPSCSMSNATCARDLVLSLFITGGLPGSAGAEASQMERFAAENTATVAAFAFIGAYVASLRYLVKALAVFDLSAYTFIRQAAMIVISVLVTIILYRALPNPLLAIADFAKPATNDTVLTHNPGIPLIWILLALSFGLLPESAIQFALVKSTSVINWIKQTDDRFKDWTRVIPLDAIDGIDYFTRFRLEECGISEVQSLATYNPIMLHIETPYGIYQAIDWIAQAQLCCVVGLDRFLLLRQFNVRTIFDLERALKQDRSLEAAEQVAIDKFDRIYAAVLFAPNNLLQGIQNTSNAKFLIPGDEPGLVREVDAGEFSKWALSSITGTPKDASRAIEHLMDWIGDDLHVRRLRRLWNEISVRLGPLSLELLGDDEIRRNAGTTSTFPLQPPFVFP